MSSRSQPPVFAVGKDGRHHEMGGRFDLFAVSIGRTPREFVINHDHAVSMSPSVSSLFSVAVHEGGRWFLGKGSLLPGADENENGEQLNDLYPTGDLAEADGTGAVASWFYKNFCGIPDEVADLLRAAPEAPPEPAPAAEAPAAKSKAKRKRGGQKKPLTPEEQRIVEAHKAPTFVDFKTLATAHGVTEEHVKTVVGRVAARERRARNKAGGPTD